MTFPPSSGVVESLTPPPSPPLPPPNDRQADRKAEFPKDIDTEAPALDILPPFGDVDVDEMTREAANLEA